MGALVGDFMFTVAEVAVAFAGFAGLVTVLSQRLSRTQAQFDVARFRDMLLLSLIASAFALFPVLPATFGASEEITWRVSSLLFALAWAGYGLQGLAAGVRLTRAGTRPFARPLFWNNLAVHLPVTFALLGVAADVGFLAGVRSAVYVTALFATLYLAGAYFVALFVSLSRG